MIVILEVLLLEYNAIVYGCSKTKFSNFYRVSFKLFCIMVPTAIVIVVMEI